MRRVAAYVYTLVTAGVVLFQLALALGAPWGSYAMGGAFPGRYPPAMRAAALVQILLLGFLAFVVLARAGVVVAGWRASRWLIWVVVAFGALSVVLNLITPSAGERLIWTPVAALLLACSVVVAVTRAGPKA